MSHMSRWDAPPLKKNRIVDLAFPLGPAAASGAATKGRPNASPATPQLEATRKVRRETEPVALAISDSIFSNLLRNGVDSDRTRQEAIQSQYHNRLAALRTTRRAS